jgi:flagellar biosynthesis protein FlhB
MEISIIVVIILLLITTNKLQDLMQESILNNDDVNYVNSLGWAAAWTLCAFNALSLLMMILDYIFDFIDYLEKRRENKKQIQKSYRSNNLINTIEN